MNDENKIDTCVAENELLNLLVECFEKDEKFGSFILIMVVLSLPLGLIKMKINKLKTRKI